MFTLPFLSFTAVRMALLPFARENHMLFGFGSFRFSVPTFVCHFVAPSHGSFQYKYNCTRYNKTSNWLPSRPPLRLVSPPALSPSRSRSRSRPRLSGSLRCLTHSTHYSTPLVLPTLSSCRALVTL